MQTQIEYNKAKYTYERTQEEAVNTLKNSIKEVSQETLMHVRLFVVPLTCAILNPPAPVLTYKLIESCP